MWDRRFVTYRTRVISSSLAAVAAVSMAVVVPATAQTTTIAMTGDPITGSLSFRQDVIDIQAGDVVRFANRNASSAHEPAERNGMWGFSVAPGQSAERTMEAGTHLIVCRLHPDFMTAAIQVAPRTALTRRVIRKRDRRGRLRSRRVVRTAHVTWAVAPPAAGRSFDVERRRQGARWTSLRSATADLSASFPDRPGDAWQVRVRMRDGNATTGWSPITPIVD